MLHHRTLLITAALTLALGGATTTHAQSAVSIVTAPLAKATPTAKPKPTAKPTAQPAKNEFDVNKDGSVSCADFGGATELAQKALKAGYKKLDRDKDGTACEKN